MPVIVTLADVAPRVPRRERLLADLHRAEDALKTAQEAYADSDEYNESYDPFGESPQGPLWAKLYEAHRSHELAKIAWADYVRLWRELDNDDADQRQVGECAA